MKQNKGFTLIELLVVVAIIGILASVVLASLNSARGKGTDSAIKGELSSIRAQAEIYYDTEGNYGDNATALCTAEMFTDPTMAKLLASVDNRNGGSTAFDNVSCSTSGSAWAVAAKLTQNDGVWCIDSSGASQGKNNAGVTYTGAASGVITSNACN